jgi:hypothetical protein
MTFLIKWRTLGAQNGCPLCSSSGIGNWFQALIRMGPIYDFNYSLLFFAFLYLPLKISLVYDKREYIFKNILYK